MEPTCPVCHVAVRPSDFFCYNCGKNLHEKPPSTQLMTQLLYYAGSILLPPFGFIWGYRYYKQDDPASKRVGMICIGLTVLSLIVTVIEIFNIGHSLNAQIDSQMQNLQGFQ